MASKSSFIVLIIDISNDSATTVDGFVSFPLSDCMPGHRTYVRSSPDSIPSPHCKRIIGIKDGPTSSLLTVRPQRMHDRNPI
ncbi:hypothetical protein CJ030_MR7G025644 [Morella rubra]|uniref:Uncharacterized protein n=1 Tax=Morella rubra TaxID=262757 RepID=A0A6A1V525_9ROSI|nr:hypothetical protein CJ030_MR7G025644 [Morella rubra]